MEEPTSLADPIALARLALEWARAWSEQRVDDYLAFYASGFDPGDGVDRAEWVEQRRRRLTAPSFIEVELTDLEARAESPSRAAVTFVQSYRSNSYRDRVRKTLILVPEDGDWKIEREVSEPAG